MPNPNPTVKVPPKAHQFQHGNPGRPKGSRNKLSETFFEALHRDFLLHGAAAIVGAREESPLGYLKVVASVIPQKFEIERTSDKVTDEELMDVIRAGTEKRLEAPPKSLPPPPPKPKPKPNVEVEGRA